MADTTHADKAKLYSPFAWSKRGIEWARDFPVFCEKSRQAGEKARAALKTVSLQYGSSEEQRIEWFRVDGERNPVFVYLHGGGWIAGDVASSALMAMPLAKEGIETAVLGYDLCPGVSLATIVEQVHAGLRALLADLPPDARLFLCGVSAGAHLAALLLASFAEERRLRGAFLLTGMYDLRPLAELRPNNPMSLTADNADALSPLCRRFPASTARVVLSVGSDESPAFKAQAQELSRRLGAAGWANVETREEEGLDHLAMSEVMETMDAPLMRRLVEVMKA